ncbi:MAG TPA: DUF1778 domain-containing protein [Rhizomicrobium sp.]|nr:DUF1778 domain-containing protein [Rhizomicrobium sp.]
MRRPRQISATYRPGNIAISCHDIVWQTLQNLLQGELPWQELQPVPRSSTSPAAKRTLNAAAAASQCSVSEFVLESALARAEETLADRRKFLLDEKQWKAFLAALDAPPTPMPRLKRLLSEPSVFEKSR